MSARKCPNCGEVSSPCHDGGTPFCVGCGVVDGWDALAAFRRANPVRPKQIADARNHTHSGTDVFEGTPDGRHSDNVTLPTSRFRPRYRALTDAEREVHDDIKAKAAELEALFEQGVPAGRYLSLALTDLESAVSWAIKALTA